MTVHFREDAKIPDERGNEGSPMIERVARAMCNATGPDEICGGPHPSGLWLEEGEPWWTGYADQARAAIAAMREPTAAMIAAMGEGFAVDPSWSDPAPHFAQRHRNAYRAMIDAALSESP